jgi:hypothetical protein
LTEHLDEGNRDVGVVEEMIDRRRVFGTAINNIDERRIRKEIIRGKWV